MHLRVPGRGPCGAFLQVLPGQGPAGVMHLVRLEFDRAISADLALSALRSDRAKHFAQLTWVHPAIHLPPGWTHLVVQLLQGRALRVGPHPEQLLLVGRLHGRVLLVSVLAREQCLGRLG